MNSGKLVRTTLLGLALLGATASLAPAASAAPPRITFAGATDTCTDKTTIDINLSSSGRVMTFAVIANATGSNPTALPRIVGPRFLSLRKGETKVPLTRITGRPSTALPRAVHMLFFIPLDRILPLPGAIQPFPLFNIC